MKMREKGKGKRETYGTVSARRRVARRGYDGGREGCRTFPFSLFPFPLLLAALLAPARPTTAPAQIVDPSGAWRTWHSAHFRVHAPARLAGHVPLVAAEAERAWAALARELDPPRGPIDLTIYDNVDLANGFATVFPSNRLSVYLATPAASVSLAHYDLWLRKLLSHELTHLFHLNRTRGVWRAAQTVFGRAPWTFPVAYQPSWVAEGVAVYYESRLTTAGRIDAAFHDQLLAAGARGRWIGPEDATLISPKWPGGFRPYAWGSRVFALEAAGYGDSVVPGFARRSAGQLWPLAVSRPLTKAGGIDVDSAWSLLAADARHAAGSAAGPAPGGEIVARGLLVEPQVALSPDGDLVAFVHDDGRSEGRVEVRRLADGRRMSRQRLTGGAELAWAGDTLYVTQLDFGSPVQLWSDLYRWLPDGRWERVTRGGGYTSPFSMGSGVGVISRAGDARTAVVLAPPDGAASRLAAPPAAEWARLSATGAGDRIAGVRHRDGRWELVVWPAGRPEAATVAVREAALVGDPAWTPDGRLLFFSERAGLPQIYEYDVASGGVARLTDEPTGAREGRMTVDGTLVYSTVLADGYAVVRRADVERRPPEPGAPPPAFEPAPPVPLRATGYRPWGALRPHYWMPFGHGEAQSGLFVGALTTGHDPIGRTSYLLAAAMSVEPWRAEAVVTAEHRRWRRVTLDVEFAQRWESGLALTTAGDTVRLGERERRVALGATWRWRRWRSGAAVRVSGDVERSDFVEDTGVGVAPFATPTFAGGTAALRLFHRTQPAFAISGENGVVLDGLYRRRWAVSDSGWSYEVRGAVSGYLALPLPGFAHWVLAGRVEAGRTGGPRPNTYRVGGESGDVFQVFPGFALGTGRRAFALRGYPRVGGFTRAVTVVGELRVPLLLVGEGVGKLPLVLDRVSLTAFGEAGGGWTAATASAATIWRDVGGEAVLDVGAGYDVPLRVRLGAAVPLRDMVVGSRTFAARGDARAYAAFGTTF